ALVGRVKTLPRSSLARPGLGRPSEMIEARRDLTLDREQAVRRLEIPYDREAQAPVADDGIERALVVVAAQRRVLAEETIGLVADLPPGRARDGEHAGIGVALPRRHAEAAQIAPRLLAVPGRLVLIEGRDVLGGEKAPVG